MTAVRKPTHSDAEIADFGTHVAVKIFTGTAHETQQTGIELLRIVARKAV